MAMLNNQMVTRTAQRSIRIKDDPSVLEWGIHSNTRSILHGYFNPLVFWY